MKYKVLLVFGIIVILMWVSITIVLFLVPPIVDRNIVEGVYITVCDIKLLDKNSTSYKIEIVRCVGTDGYNLRYLDAILPPKSVITVTDYNNSLGNINIGETYRLKGDVGTISKKFTILGTGIIPQQGDLLEAVRNATG